MEPLQCLPQQPLTGPEGERLVLCNRDAGYPDSENARGRWFAGIASTNTTNILRLMNPYSPQGDGGSGGGDDDGEGDEDDDDEGGEGEVEDARDYGDNVYGSGGSAGGGGSGGSGGSGDEEEDDDGGGDDDDIDCDDDDDDWDDDDDDDDELPPPDFDIGDDDSDDNDDNADDDDDDDDGGDDNDDFSKWLWAAVVLTPAEYKLRVGGMSVTELRGQLEKYWGQGGIPGEDCYHDIWVPAWVPDGDDNPYHLSSSGNRLDPVIFSHWVNGECAKWLQYFIANNHTLGAVHAWFAAFLGVTRACRFRIAKSLKNMAAIPRVKFRMSFDLCIKDHDQLVHGLPSLFPDSKITTNNQGIQVIVNNIDEMFPRRIWDICANTIIPAAWFCGPPCPLTGGSLVGAVGVKPVSHAWVADGDLTFIVTEANQQLWPIPLPRGVLLEDIRGEMIRLGVRYAWLDVLCLRQQAQPALAKDLPLLVSREVIERRRQHQLEEWKVDVPTIGATYSNQNTMSLYGKGPTVIFISGLGRPFRDEAWASDRHWLRRAWTLQETPPLSQCLIAGLPGGVNYQWDCGKSRGLWPWNCRVGDVLPPIRSISHYISHVSCATGW